MSLVGEQNWSICKQFEPFMLWGVLVRWEQKNLAFILPWHWNKEPQLETTLCQFFTEVVHTQPSSQENSAKDLWPIIPPPSIPHPVNSSYLLLHPRETTRSLPFENQKLSRRWWAMTLGAMSLFLCLVNTGPHSLMVYILKTGVLSFCSTGISGKTAIQSYCLVRDCLEVLWLYPSSPNS